MIRIGVKLMEMAQFTAIYSLQDYFENKTSIPRGWRIYGCAGMLSLIMMGKEVGAIFSPLRIYYYLHRIKLTGNPKEKPSCNESHSQLRH